VGCGLRAALPAALAGSLRAVQHVFGWERDKVLRAPRLAKRKAVSLLSPSRASADVEATSSLTPELGPPISLWRIVWIHVVFCNARLLQTDLFLIPSFHS